jgi:nucleoside-diphosphate-sugar epimerase
MKKIIIAGATGMIGGLILKRCLEHNDVSSITSIGRRSTGIVHPKLEEIIHSNFLDFSAVEGSFKDKDVCFYCIGVYTGQVPQKEFVKITVDYTKVFAETLKRNSPQASFCFLSGEGADLSEKSSILFAREKGKAENILLRLGFKATRLFRPGYIFPVTPRNEPNFMYRVYRFLYKYGLSKIAGRISVTSEQLCDVMVDVGLNGGDKVIYGNNDIRRHKN